MGRHNILIDGVSCSGKTTVCHALQQRGFHALNGDRDLAMQGDPTSGLRTRMPSDLTSRAKAEWQHAHHIWDVQRLRDMIADHSKPRSFFCGGARNAARFIKAFDAVILLQIDRDTLIERLSKRPDGEFGSAPAERDLILILHATERDMPKNATRVDACQSIAGVIEDILDICDRIP